MTAEVTSEPILELSPIHRLEHHAAFHPRRIAVHYEGRDVDYREFRTEIAGLAAALQEEGVRPGDRVAYWGLNSYTLLTVYHACAWVGAVFVPVNFRLAVREASAVLADARPDVIVAEPEYAERIDPVLGRTRIRTALVVDDDGSLKPVDSLSAVWRSYREFRQGAVEVPPVVRSERDLACLIYTSGTTGTPKGVMLSHGNLWWNQVNTDAVMDTRIGDVVLVVVPMFHIGGLNSFTLGALARGGTVVVRRRFDARQTLADLVSHRVTAWFAPPAILEAMVQLSEFAGADLSALRDTVVGGAPVPSVLVQQYLAKGVNIQQAYGMTETSPTITYLEAAFSEAKLGSCGVPVPYTSVKLMDPRALTEVTEAGERGEIWVRGPNVFLGYWENAEATSEAITSDGWFRTGDIGHRDGDGFYTIVDRLKDMIISGGENIYCAELEKALVAHPAVGDCAVVGVPHEKWGETPCAVLSLREGRPAPGIEEIRDFLSPLVARYKLPTQVVVVPSVPRTDAGKLDKSQVRSLVHTVGGGSR